MPHPPHPARCRLTGLAMACALAPALLLAPTARADMYGYVDGNGRVHVSSARLDARYKLFSKELPGPQKRVSAAKSRKQLARLLSSRGRAKVAAALAAKLPYGRLVERAALRHGVEAALVHAVIQAESGYDPRAVSDKGAVGLMQLMPETAALYGAANREDPAQNIAAGTRYLGWLLARFKGNVTLALAAYNAGEGNVAKYGNAVPPFEETRTYVTRVMEYYRRYRV